MKKKPKPIAARDVTNIQILWKQMQQGKLQLSKTLPTYNIAFKDVLK